MKKDSTPSELREALFCDRNRGTRRVMEPTSKRPVVRATPVARSPIHTKARARVMFRRRIRL